jgi:hypothetical protein
MTHTDVSEESQLILDRFSEQTLIESVVSCIGKPHHQDNQNKLTSIIEYIRDECSKCSPPHYIEESTSGDKKDPQTRLGSQLRNGWQTGGGFRLPLTEVPEWGAYDNHSRNVRYKVHSWVMLDSLLVVDSITEGHEYLDLAIDIADGWIGRFVISSVKDDFAWYDMAVGQRATKLAYMLRRLVDIDAPTDQIFRFILASEIHYSELSNNERIAVHSNHGLFQMAGLLSLCHNLPWMLKSSGGIEFAEEILQKMLSEHFAEDGLHLEHSPDYHLYMVNHLQSLKDSGWLSQKFEPILTLVNSVVDAAEWMPTPNHHVIPIGDTANNVLMTKRWAGYQGNLNLGTKLFPIGGLFIHNSQMQSSISQLIFSAQFHSRQHKHADQLSVLYNLFGQPLLVDPGTFTYQYDIPERMYCESTRGHNTVEIDGLNYSRFRQDVFGSAMTLVAKAGDCVIAEGKVKHTRLISSAIPNNKIKSTDAVPVDISHRRIVIERPGYFLAIIDEVISDEEHEYIPWYHFHPDLSVRKDTSTRLAVVSDEGQKYCQIQCYDNDSNNIGHIESKGQKNPSLQGWYSRNGRELIENCAIGFPLVGNSHLWTTVFDFNMQKTGKPYLRMGTGGKYLRFALTQDSEKMDVKIKVDKDGTRTIEVEIDNSPVEVNIEFDEG